MYNKVKLPIQKVWGLSILLPKLIFWVLVNTLSQFPCSVPSVIQKQWKKPHHYHVISSSGLHTKDKRRTFGAYCSLATSFGPSSATFALLVVSQEAKNLHYTSAWFLSFFSWYISTVVIRAPYQVFLRVCFRIQGSWIAHSLFFCWMNFLPFYWTGLTHFL